MLIGAWKEEESSNESFLEHWEMNGGRRIYLEYLSSSG